MGIYLGVFSMTPVVWYKDIQKLWRVYRQETLIVLLGLTLLILGGLGAELFKGGFQLFVGLYHVRIISDQKLSHNPPLSSS
ncbi:MAG: hypothetical protein WAN66_26835 [Limnoraphis robusta]